MNLIKEKKDLEILDLGAGSASTSILIKSKLKICSIIAIDFIEKIATYLKSLKYKQDNVYDKVFSIDFIEYLQDSSHKFDIIYGSNLVNYYQNLAPIFKLFYSNLKDGGFLAFSFEIMEDDKILSYDKQNYCHNYDKTLDLLNKAKFKNVNVKKADIFNKSIALVTCEK